MSPGSVTEKLHFFVAEYDPSMRIGSGGGNPDERARTSRCWNYRSIRRSR